MSLTGPGARMEALATMLRSVFGDSRFTLAYLQWQYEQSPEGLYVTADMMEGEEFLAHYAVVPQTWELNDRLLPLALSLNTAVTASAQRRGLFTDLAEQTYAKARDLRGIQAILGVGNVRSTPGLVRRLGFRLIAPLPVIVGLSKPCRDSAIQELDGTRESLASDAFDKMAGSISSPADGLMRQRWTPEKLRWRLDSPLGPFVIHIHETGILISKRKLQWGIPLVLALAFLPRNGASKIAARALIKAACAAHGTPFFVHAGLNTAVRLTGLPLPQRLKPRPLNLTCRPLEPLFPDDVAIGRFEFLDFDAY